VLSGFNPFLESVSLEELVMAVRRQSQGFARGSSGYRGVTHHPNGRWEARIGMPGSKHIYLGLYNEESAAARAYDRALELLQILHYPTTRKSCRRFRWINLPKPYA